MPRHLILLPGLDGTGTLFAPFIRALPEAWTAEVIAYPAQRALTKDEYVAFVRARLPIDRPFVLVAESFSGPIALELAAGAPHALTHLVLCATFATPPRRQRVRAVMRLLRHPAAFRLPAPSAIVRWALLERGSPNLDDVMRSGRAVAPQVLASRIALIRTLDARELLPRITVPTLVLHAMRDRIITRADADDLVAGLPHATLVELDAPHLLLQDAPDAASAAIAQFVE